jgi:ribosomal protein S6--L-glutamate ligase
LSHSPLIVYDNKSFNRYYQELQPGDLIATHLRLTIGEEHILLDLVERGIILIPSATAQLASRSKTFQTRIFQRFMLPGTTAIYNKQSLLEAISLYNKLKVDKIVVKQDRKNAGQGIFLFSSIEEVYTLTANNVIPLPFVLQPFLQSSFDIRVIMLGEYIEAYQRKNPGNFRNNLHCGGTASPHELSSKQLDFCKEVMKRGNFPYCHLDIMGSDNDDLYLTEVNLRGGIQGAKIATEEYMERKKVITQLCVKRHLGKQRQQISNKVY